MGKAIIVPGVDWSNNNLGQVTANELVISGHSNVVRTGEFSAIFAGNAVNAQWAISDNTVASLSSSIGNTITITVLQNGTATLTATYNGKTASLYINCSNGSFTEANITQDNLTYYNASGKTRTCVILPDIVNSSTYHGTVSNSSGTIKFGIQIWDSNHPIPTQDSSNPTSDLNNAPNTVWDSGWITQGQSKSFDGTCDKDNSIGSANSSAPPARIAIAATYTADNTGMPSLAEIKAALTLSYYPE